MEDIKQTNRGDAENILNDGTYLVDQSVTVITYKPKTWLKTLSEVGGLLVLFKISIFMALAHE